MRWMVSRRFIPGLALNPITTTNTIIALLRLVHGMNTLVMSGIKTCKILARILQDINQGKNINRGTNVLGNIFEEIYCLLNELQNRIQ